MKRFMLLIAFVLVAAVSCQKEPVIDFPHGCIYRSDLGIHQSDSPNKVWYSEIVFSLNADRFNCKNEYTGDKYTMTYVMDDHTARDEDGQLLTFADNWKSFKYKNRTYYLEDFVPELYNNYK